MKSVFTRLVLAYFTPFAAASLAQPTSMPGAGNPPPRPLMDRFGRGAMMADPTAMLDQMKTELKLDNDQETAVRKLFDDYRNKMSELRRGMAMTPDETAHLNDLRKQMVEARKSGNQDTVTSIGQQMKAVRDQHQDAIGPVQEQMRQAREGLRGQIEGILHDDQKAGFEKLWTEQSTGMQSSKDRIRRNPRMLKGLVDRLPDLTSEQKTKLDELFKGHMDATRNEKPGSPNTASLNTKLYDGVMAILTPEQRQKLEERMDGRRGPGDRRMRNREPPKPGEGNGQPGEPPPVRP